VIEASEIIGELATVMGSSFEKPMKILLLPTLSTLTDPKPQVRQTVIETLSKIRSNVGLQMILPGISSTLMTDHLNLRKDLLKWLSERNQDEYTASDYQQLIHPIFLCLQDRNTDVRKLAQELFMHMGNALGADILKEKASDLFRGASLASLMPFLDSLKPSNAAKVPVVEKTDSGSKSKPKSLKPRGLPDTAKALSRGASVESLNSNFANILVTDFKAKEQRAAADKGILKWNFESPRKDLTDHLAEQCSTVFSTEFHALLFSNEHYKERDHMNGLTRLCDELNSRHTNEIACGLTSADLKQRYLSCSDMLLKYITIRFFDTNTTILLKVLEFLELLFTTMEEESYLLSDYEASCFLPFLINKVSYLKF
jgi:cytoskeleton-associated protein 5